MRLIDSTCLGMEYLLSFTYEADFVTAPFCNDIFTDNDTFHKIRELFVTYAKKPPTISPNVLISAQGVLQKVLALRGYVKEGVLFVMWGGFSHKDHWFEVPQGDYEPGVLDSTPVAFIGGFAVQIIEEPSNSGKAKASKLSTLEVGAYKIDSVKPVSTTFGDTYIVTISGLEYWANAQLSGLIRMLGDTAKLSGGTLTVLTKGETNAGRPTVKVGLAI